MKEIPSINVSVKLSQGHEDQYVLVHDGKQVITLAPPHSGKVATHAQNTMLAGTYEELQAQINTLKLTVPASSPHSTPHSIPHLSPHLSPQSNPPLNPPIQSPP